MDKLFHSNCFCCMSCHRPLQGMQFYDRDGCPQCDDCYMVRTHSDTIHMHTCIESAEQCWHSDCAISLCAPGLLPGFMSPSIVPSLLPQGSLAVCSRCGERITDRVLKAVGQSFHSHCFRCSTCSCVLEGAPFITDDNNNPYCVQDYHRWLLARVCSVVALMKIFSTLILLIKSIKAVFESVAILSLSCNQSGSLMRLVVVEERHNNNTSSSFCLHWMKLISPSPCVKKKIDTV